jgi:hypothetical protein
VNLDRIERLKGLLSRVELNAKKPRRSPAAPALTAPVAAAPALTAPVAAAPAKTAPVTAAPAKTAPVTAPTAARAIAAPMATPIAPPVAAPSPPTPPAAIDVAQPKESVPPISLDADEFEVEDVSLDDFAVEISPPAPAVAVAPPTDITPSPAQVSAKPSAPLMSQPKPVLEVEEATEADLEVEDLGRPPPAEEQPIVSVSAPIQTSVQASPKPFTDAPPGLDELTFSEPPPARKSAPPSGRTPEPPPVSSRHAISEAPESIDAALIAAAHAETEDREGPLLTPPPESGKQPARPSTVESPPYRQAAPTIEQLGDVVELEELGGPSLELAEVPEPAPSQTQEELEFVPQSVARPPTAREAQPTLVGGFPEEEEPTSQRVAAELSKATQKVALKPEVIERRPIAAAAVANVVSQAQSFRPKSFLELLDASLKLGKP